MSLLVPRSQNLQFRSKPAFQWQLSLPAETCPSPLVTDVFRDVTVVETTEEGPVDPRYENLIVFVIALYPAGTGYCWEVTMKRPLLAW
ncbi:hypothetical protein OUZ56_010671 [Daphnia magna]|uniref:Uncharacterized protein n=1 Tax=Daphnia magna TaxID=35525 RepID=A0ABR0AJ76_9CRUS|nr:hypothetical protein OUZ56_010671 [Daphnia magna]